MQRREYIALGGASIATSIAGCSEVQSLAGGNEYEQGEEDSLLFDEPQSDWPDDMNADHDFNDNFDRCFINDDETIFVFMSAEIYEDVSTAENAMERSRATASDPNDYPLADEAFVFDDGETASFLFRHSNAQGNTMAGRVSGRELKPDRTRATDYGDYLFEHWQE